jgi:hypothetical protein
MKADVGDRIVVASTVVDGPLRDGRVVEVRHADGTPPYVVEWSDTGERTLVFPGPDAHIEHLAAPGGGDVVAPATRRVTTWTVQVHLVEDDDDTTAQAVLIAPAPTTVEAVGRARRNPRDPAVPVIGDEVAVARALRRLADRLIEAAKADIQAATGQPGSVAD